MPPLTRCSILALLGAGTLALAACGGSTTAAAPAPASPAAGLGSSPSAGASPSASAATTAADPGATGTATPSTAPTDSAGISATAVPLPTAAPVATSSAGASPVAVAAGSPPAAATLPDGSSSIFPQHRVVALYGPPDGSITRNILGRLTPAQAVVMTKQMAAAFKGGGKPVLPAFEVIAQIAQGSPGTDGDYAAFYDDADIQKWVDAATQAGFLIVLDLQPGQGDFYDGAQHLQKWLKLPNVGLALDAEWNMKKGEIPGSVIGSVDAAKVNQVSQWLSHLTATNHLPQKLLVVHQFTDSAITDKAGILPRSNLATVIHVDGFGGQANKIAKYDDLSVRHTGEYNGFKLFLEDDVGLLTPQQTLALKPTPDLITYQ